MVNLFSKSCISLSFYLTKFAYSFNEFCIFLLFPVQSIIRWTEEFVFAKVRARRNVIGPFTSNGILLIRFTISDYFTGKCHRDVSTANSVSYLSLNKRFFSKCRYGVDRINFWWALKTLQNIKMGDSTEKVRKHCFGESRWCLLHLNSPLVRPSACPPDCRAEETVENPAQAWWRCVRRWGSRRGRWW